MKTYNSKSNAKRASKAIAAANPGLVACEPVDAGGGNWFAAVMAAGQGSVISIAVRESAKIIAGVHMKTEHHPLPADDVDTPY